MVQKTAIEILFFKIYGVYPQPDRLVGAGIRLLQMSRNPMRFHLDQNLELACRVVRELVFSADVSQNNFGNVSTILWYADALYGDEFRKLGSDNYNKETITRKVLFLKEQELGYEYLQYYYSAVKKYMAAHCNS